MPWRRFLATFLVLASALSISAQAGRAQGLSAVEFEKLHQELQSPREPWQSIPWKLSLLDAQAQAAKEKKPIYMLCRIGHPLGCV
jgi:hypothetical protein